MHRVFLGAFLLALPPAQDLDPVEELGLRVAPGFRVSLYSDQALANDIHAMTLDARGRVVVTSRGWIKILHDADGDGRADRATLFAESQAGGMGLCFDGNDLYCYGDPFLCRYRDKDGAGRADGPPENILRLRGGEHGAHGLRKGPDGGWYHIGGNDAEIDRRCVTLPNSPVRDPEAGGIVRFTADWKSSEVIAHGFRNPYRFDFNEAGDLFTYDSDVERDFFLPWYTPTRLYHIGYGLHHGWRLKGSYRGFCRLDHYPDTTDILWPVGRGSPTGVVCYRHDQFPERYRGGLFALDWTFGKVYFFPLRPDGASYSTRPEIFLEPTGTEGFAPTDAAVAPDGSLFISIGGRGTRGAVYRIQYAGEPSPQRPPPATELGSVLHAHQPLDAWSRARWMPAAQKLGREPFEAALTGKEYDVPARVRAVEILTELFGGVRAGSANAAARDSDPRIRARVAWALGRISCEGFADILAGLAEDADPRVRRCAMEALADRAAEDERARAILLPNLAHADKRVRQAAARLAALIPENSWKALQANLEKAGPQARLTGALAAIRRAPELADSVLETALRVLGATTDVELRLQAVRLVVLALGDCNLHHPPVEVHANYSLPAPVPPDKSLRILKAVRPIFPSGDSRLDVESSRLLAMLEDEDPESPGKAACFWTEKSSPTEDLHYLIVLSRLRGPQGPELAAKTARILLSFNRRMKGQEQRSNQIWSQRLSEVLQVFIERNPGVADEIIKDPNFVHPAHVVLAAGLDSDHRREAARLFFAAAKENAGFVWSGPLMDLLAVRPADEVHPLFRAQWSNFSLRDAILSQLAEKPDPVDRDRFLTGLESSQNRVIHVCLEALKTLPRDDSPKNLIPLLRLLRRLMLDPKQGDLRAEALTVIGRQCGRTYAFHEEKTDPVTLKQAYHPVFDEFVRQNPALARELEGDGGEDPEAWKKVLASVPWDKGDAGRGEAVFRSRCFTCHSGPRALGPDLSGSARRFSREDLFTAIIYPSLDVAPPYRTTAFFMKDGQIFTGIVAFESADGYILQTGATTTVRIRMADVESKRPGTLSLMPSALLKDLKPADLADLYGYLRAIDK